MVGFEGAGEVEGGGVGGHVAGECEAASEGLGCATDGCG